MKTSLQMFGMGFLLVMFATTAALAHALLDHAQPKVGSTVSKEPTEIKLWFSQKVEPAFSAIEVLDANGKQIDKKDSHVDGHDKTLLIVSVPSLAAGEYRVQWHVVSADTHKTKGDFKFQVRPKG